MSHRIRDHSESEVHENFVAGRVDGGVNLKVDQKELYSKKIHSGYVSELQEDI